MKYFLIKRFLELIPVCLILASLTFFTIRLAPGGPFDSEKAFSPEVLKNLDTYYGLQDSLGQQYLRFLKQLLKGDLGPSLVYPSYKVSELIAERLPCSLELGFLSFLFACILGGAVGFVASAKPHSLWDRGLMGLTTLGICLPSYLLAPILLLVFGIKLQWLNASGWDTWQDKLLPVLTLGLLHASYIARILRGSMMEISILPYIRAAYAKGLSPQRVLGIHTLKNALQPLIAYLAPSLATLITGSFVVENIFRVPGLGYFFVQGTFSRDYTLVMGVVLFYGLLLLIMSAVADILLAWVNPRIRLN